MKLFGADSSMGRPSSLKPTAATEETWSSKGTPAVLAPSATILVP